MPNADLIGSAEVAERLGLDRSTLNRHVRAGKLTPALKLPGETGAYLFDRAAIEALAADQAATAS